MDLIEEAATHEDKGDSAVLPLLLLSISLRAPSYAGIKSAVRCSRLKCCRRANSEGARSIRGSGPVAADDGVGEADVAD